MEHFLTKISIMLVPALLAVILHEVAHGYIAERRGDPTARLLGRLTMNPLKHLDPIGTLALLFFGFGWARPVPVNFSNLKNPRQDMVWVALAGPITNLLLAACSALLLKILAFAFASLPADSAIAQGVLQPIALMAGFSIYINIILAVFNMVPIPPLDGGRVLTGLLPTPQAAMLARIEPYGFFLVILLIFFTGLWQQVLGPIIMYLVAFLSGDQILFVQTAISFLLGG